MTRFASRIGLAASALLATGLAAAAQDRPWTDLFDGRSLAGWTQRNGTGTYRAEAGAVIGRTTEDSPNSFLCTNADYGDFELEFEVKVDDRLNSGLQLRSSLLPRDMNGEKAGRVFGPQVEIAANAGEGSLSGFIYGEATGRGWLSPPERAKPHRLFRNGDWNAYRVLAEGPRLRTWLNGQPVEDLTDPLAFETNPRGFLCLQVHAINRGEGPYEVAWRNLRLRQ
jgi:hypothetical protein